MTRPTPDPTPLRDQLPDASASLRVQLDALHLAAGAEYWRAARDLIRRHDEALADGLDVGEADVAVIAGRAIA